MVKARTKKVRIDIETRGDRFYVSSKEIPGLWLWGKDPEVVFNNVSPAIEALYKHNHGVSVRVRETTFSRLKCWLVVRLFKATREIDQPKVYLVSERHLNQAHG